MTQNAARTVPVYTPPFSDRLARGLRLMGKTPLFYPHPSGVSHWWLIEMDGKTASIKICDGFVLLRAGKSPTPQFYALPKRVRGFVAMRLICRELTEPEQVQKEREEEIARQQRAEKARVKQHQLEAQKRFDDEEAEKRLRTTSRAAFQKMLLEFGAIGNDTDLDYNLRGFTIYPRGGYSLEKARTIMRVLIESGLILGRVPKTPGESQ